MRCPNCAEAELVHDTRDVPYLYKGESTTIPRVTGEFCPVCGETVLDASESTRSSATMLEFNKQVNASMVDPEFIARVPQEACARSARGRGDLRGWSQCLLPL